MLLQNFCRLINLKNSTVIFLLVGILLDTREVRGSRSNKRNSRKWRRDIADEDGFNEMVKAGEIGLIRFIEDKISNFHDENYEPHLRKIRSPLDDDIDDVEDEDSDDSDEEDDKEKKSKKEKVTSAPSVTPAPSSTANVGQVSKPSPLPPTSVASMDISHSSNITLDTTTKSSAQINSNHSLRVGSINNGTGKVMLPFPPPGFKPPPDFIVGGKSPPGAFPPNGKPHGNGSFHFPGKLPPQFLKNIPTPRPPAKKGELYLPEEYNNLVIPKLNLGKLIGIDSYSAVPVLIFLNIRSVRDIDEEMETLNLDLDLVIEWVDGFLFDPISAAMTRQADITLNPIFLKKIWRPDIYIDEIVKVKRTSLMNKPLKLKFNPSNGFISYTTRLAVQLSCDMIYTFYPADTHRCEFTFRSYSYFSKDMELSWLGTGVYLQDPYDPNFDLQVESIDHIKLPQTFRKLTNDTYDALRFTILARRKLSFHMVQTYLPSIFFIIITWLCFLVPSRMVEARIGISMTTLLTLTSMFASVRESTPIVSYVKAIDIWMVCCIFFVFLTLLEFATLVWMRSRREDAEEEKLEHQRKLQEKMNGALKGLDATFTRSSSLTSAKLQTYELFAEFTEKYAFLIFSVVFIVFNVIYWTWLLSASNYFDWNVNGTLNAEVD